MIGKAGTGASFRGLSNYLEQDEKIEWKESRNLPGTNKNQNIRLMEDTASMSKAEQPVYHLSISYAEIDNPTRKMMIEDATATLSTLGLSEHQTVFVAHKDTAHKHLHVMVNRVHPTEGKAWNAYQDRFKIREKMLAIEHTRGFEKTRLQTPEMERDIDLKNSEWQQFQDRGLEAMPLKVKAEFYDFDKVFEQAQGWEDLRNDLGEFGCKIKTKGRGGVIEDIRTGKELKLSRVDRKHSFGRLEKRFGKFKDFDKTLQAHKELRQYFPKNEQAMKSFAKFARAEKFGSKSLKESTKKAFKKTLSKSWSIGKTMKGLTSLAASSNPMSGPAKIGLKMAKSITKQLNKGRGR